MLDREQAHNIVCGMTLKQAVKKLGGPHRAAMLYNAAYVGTRDSLGDKIERLPRSTLETWVNGTAKTKATDVIRRMLDLAARSPAALEALLAVPTTKRSSRGKVKKAPQGEAEARDVT